MTPKQREFIKHISDVTGADYDENMSTSEASKWISANINEYHQEVLEDECNSYGLPNQ